MSTGKKKKGKKGKIEGEEWRGGEERQKKKYREPEGEKISSDNTIQYGITGDGRMGNGGIIQCEYKYVARSDAFIIEYRVFCYYLV